MVSWWLLVVVLIATVICYMVESCNVRELSRIVEDRFRQEVSSSCGGLGEKCSFDRDCCDGMECKMSANKMGVDNFCDNRVTSNVGEDNTPLMESGELPVQQSSAEDGAWMLTSMLDTSGHREEGDNPTVTLDKIDELEEKRRCQLIKENEDLEKLFTERDEKELEQLRSLKEDAEMGELRRLKELKLKRKLDLLREIEELRGLKAQQDLDKLDQLRNKNIPAANESTVNTTIPGEDWNERNTTVGLVEGGLSEPRLYDPLNTTVIETENYTQYAGQGVIEKTTATHKQGIHRNRKHHQGKHKKKSHEIQANIPQTKPPTVQ